MKDFDPVGAAHVAQVVRICQLIPTVVALYDHMTTFDQEIELVWKKPRNLAKALFLWNRYFGSIFLLTNAIMISVSPSHDNLYVSFCLFFFFFGMLSTMSFRLISCRFWFVFQACGTAVIVWSMQSTVLFCTCAMYPHSPYLKIAAFISFVCEVVSMAVVLIFSFMKFEALDPSKSGFLFCIPNHTPPFFYAFWIPVIALDCIYFVLALWILLKRRERGACIFATSSSVLHTLARDSLMYFFVTWVIYVANALIWMVLPAMWVGLPQAFSIAGTSIMGVKLAFNLRGVYYCHSISVKSDGRVAAPTQDSAFNNEIPDVTISFHVSEITSTPRKNANDSPS